MASDILGLFGGVSPQQMQNQYLDQQMVSPAQLGAQGLLQQVVSLGGNAGSMLGYGAGRLLGGKVAGEVEATTINDAIKYASSKGNTAADKMEAVAEYLADKPGMGAQYMKAMQEAKKLRQEQTVTDRDEGARKAVAALPPNASPEDVMTAIQPFVSPSDVYKGAVASQQKREAADAKMAQITAQSDARMDQVKAQAAARIQAAEEAAQTRLLIAEQSNMSREAIAAMNQQNQNQIAQMRADAMTEAAKIRADTAIQIASMKSEAAKQNAPKDVAEAEGAIITTMQKVGQGSDLVKMLQDPKNEGLMTRWNVLKQKGATYLALEDTDQALKIDNVESFITDSVNTILLAAKGVQAKDDAVRAQRQILGEAGKGTNAGYINAIKRVEEWAKTVVDAQKAYMKRRGFEFKDNTDNKDDPLGLR